MAIDESGSVLAEYAIVLFVLSMAAYPMLFVFNQHVGSLQQRQADGYRNEVAAPPWSGQVQHIPDANYCAPGIVIACP